MVEESSDCPICGSLNLGGTKFCTNCGERLSAPQPIETSQGEAQRRGSPVWAISVGLLLVLATAGAGLYLGLLTDEEDVGGNVGFGSSEGGTAPVKSVEASLFTAEIPIGWQEDRLDEPDSSRFISQWSDPDNPGISVLVDTQIAEASGSVMDSARQVRAQTQQSPGYAEVSFEEISLNGKTTAEWIFDLPGERRIDYLFSECGVGIAVLGVAPLSDFDEVAPTFREVAASVEPNCESITSESPISTQGIGPVLVGMTKEEAEAAGRIRLIDQGGPGGSCVYYYSDEVEGVGFMFNEGTLARIDASDAYARTLSGVGVGDTATEVYDAYGDRIEEEPNFYDPENSSYLTFIPEEPSDNTRVLFDIRDDVVVNIRAGRLPEINYVEGCA